MVQGFHPNPSAALAMSLSQGAASRSICPHGAILLPILSHCPYITLAASAPFHPQPLRMTRSFNSSNLDLAAQVWDSGIQELRKNKTPGTGTALGSLQVLNKWRVCPASAPSQGRSLMAPAEPGVPAGCDPISRPGTEGLGGFV